MKIAIMGLSASALLFSLGLGAVNGFHHSRAAPLVEGKDKPILLARMVVTATPLAD